MNNELIKVNYNEETEKPTVSGRELHSVLEIETPYHKWFPRMCEYGFTEKEDFWTILSESTGGRPSTDHQLTISMAKELCMIQRNEKGKQFRQYFIKVEEAWNTPEAVMARALKIAAKKIGTLEVAIEEKNRQIATLTTTNETLASDILEWADRPLINAIIRRYANRECSGSFGNAWTDFKKELLYKHSINLNTRKTIFANRTGKKTTPGTLEFLTDDEVVPALQTAVSMCEDKKVDVSDLLSAHKEKYERNKTPA